MRFKIPGDIFSYYGRERQLINEAGGQWGVPSPEEMEMMKAQAEAVKQSYEDRKATRDMILAEMGFKVGDKDGKKTLVPLSKEERLKIMSKADVSRGEAKEAYAGRAKAALTGTTKLPSFLKQDIDYKKATEQAMLEEILGPDALKSTAGQQAIAALKQKESDIRQGLQEQDIAAAPGMMQELGGQLSAGRSSRIGAYEALPRVNEGLIAGRAGMLQNMQQARLGELQRRLGELEAKRQRITSLFTLGGTVGGSAIASANQRKSNVSDMPTNTGGSYWGSSYSPSGSFYDEDRLGRLYGGGGSY